VSDRIDRTRPVPLWAQLLEDLRARLAAGEFGDRFPTDRELTETYGVSRHTAREAVRHLTAEGVLQRERGRGSTVLTPEFEQPLGALYSLFRSIEAQGVEQRSDVLALAAVTDAEVAGRLGVDPHEPLIHLERLRLAGGEPLALDRVWLPATVA
jgi:GntR family transcriptional regulator